MPRLGERHYRLLLDVVGELHDARSLAELRALVLPALRRAVPADFAAYSELVDGKTQVSVTEPVLDARFHAVWEAHALDNPLLRFYLRTRDGRPYRWSDVATAAEVRSTALYRELYEPNGVEHQIAFTLPSPARVVIAIALSRGGSDFSDNERTMLDLARPHLVQAYRQVQLTEGAEAILAAVGAGADDGRACLVALDRTGTVRHATDAARALVARVGAGPLRPGRAAPAELGRSVADGAGSGTVGTGVDAVLWRRLRSDAEGVVLLLEGVAHSLAPSALEELGLTLREAEVLSTLARGLTTGQAAEALGLSPRTIHKHSQRINAKLGVSTRAQAVATAWAAAGLR